MCLTLRIICVKILLNSALKLFDKNRRSIKLECVIVKFFD